MDINKETIEKIVRQVVAEKLKSTMDNSCGVAVRYLPQISLEECDRLDTGYSFDKVYTKDLLTLEQSPRLGCGLMEMTKTTFEWNLNYDEIDYVIEGTLNIICNGKTKSASAGEILYIPKGSLIQFSVPDHARFLYVTYPADWASQ